MICLLPHPLLFILDPVRKLFFDYLIMIEILKVCISVKKNFKLRMIYVLSRKRIQTD